MNNDANQYIGEFNALCKKYLTIENFEQYKNYIEKMQEIMDSLEETENIGTDDAIFKWIDNLDLEEEEKEIQ